MMGLEPTTFCMASGSSVRARSHQFAESLRLQVILTTHRTEANANDYERDHCDHAAYCRSGASTLAGARALRALARAWRSAGRSSRGIPSARGRAGARR